MKAVSFVSIEYGRPSRCESVGHRAPIIQQPNIASLICFNDIHLMAYRQTTGRYDSSVMYLSQGDLSTGQQFVTSVRNLCFNASMIPIF